MFRLTARVAVVDAGGIGIIRQRHEMRNYCVWSIYLRLDRVVNRTQA
jgi:hypothetical protein